MGDCGEFFPPVPCPDEYQPLTETGGTAVCNGYIADQCMGQYVYVGQALGSRNKMGLAVLDRYMDKQ